MSSRVFSLLVPVTLLAAGVVCADPRKLSFEHDVRPIYGETDEWGHHAVKDLVHHYDWHATLLHCFGLDHTQLTYKRNGMNASLTDGQEARGVDEILA